MRVRPSRMRSFIHGTAWGPETDRTPSGTHQPTRDFQQVTLAQNLQVFGCLISSLVEALTLLTLTIPPHTTPRPGVLSVSALSAGSRYARFVFPKRSWPRPVGFFGRRHRPAGQAPPAAVGPKRQVADAGRAFGRREANSLSRTLTRETAQGHRYQPSIGTGSAAWNLFFFSAQSFTHGPGSVMPALSLSRSPSCSRAMLARMVMSTA